MRRIKITLAYDGTDFHGWQIQPDVPTIQGVLEDVVSEIEGRFVRVAGASRTDAGVHALGQVAAFSIRNPIPLKNLRKAMNDLLPPAIRVLEVEEVPRRFHPRFDSVAKTYEYRIYRGEILSPFEHRYVHHHPYPLDVDRMIKVAPVFEGEHDFAAFGAGGAEAAEGTTVRTIYSSRIEVHGDRLIYRVRGSSFLRHMVRNMMGTLIEVGKGNLTEDDIREMLQPSSPRKGGPRAPACGLYLVNVEFRELTASNITEASAVTAERSPND